MPNVSVNICAYNAGPYIAQTLDSVLAQTYQDWECIIVDDGSTDNTVEVVEKYIQGDSRFKLVRIDPASKQPFPACRNVALDHSQGRWIAPLDSDDWWEPWKLERQVAMTEAQPGKRMCGGGAWYWKDGKITGKVHTVPSEQMGAMLPIRNITSQASSLIDRQTMIDVGKYDLQMRTAQDWDLWLRILFKFGPDCFMMMEEPCLYYRQHDNNNTRSMLRCNKYEWIIIRRSVRHYLLRNPKMAWRILSHNLLHDSVHFERNHYNGRALYRAIGALLINPLGLYRWRRTLHMLRVCLTQGLGDGQPQT